MKRLIAILLLTCGTSFASWDKGFNFRATSGYVTDGTNETFVIDTDAYPTTRNGVTFGWTSAPSGAGGGSRDRDNTIDRRIAGINFVGNTNTPCAFQVDLPATGIFKIQLGYGDAGGNSQSNYIDVDDSATNLISFRPQNTAATPTFGDAVGSTYIAAVWPGSEATVTKTFATTTFKMVLGDVALGAGTNSVISHIFISQVATTSPPTGLIINGAKVIGAGTLVIIR